MSAQHYAYMYITRCEIKFCTEENIFLGLAKWKLGAMHHFSVWHFALEMQAPIAKYCQKGFGSAGNRTQDLLMIGETCFPLHH